MSLVYLARHGETTWNLAGRYQGRRESALSGLGVRQGVALGEAIARRPRIARIISSPLWRCLATARFVADRVDRTIEIDPLLSEIAHGTWEGRYRDEISENDRERYRRWRLDPASVGFDGGETLGDVQHRWLAFTKAFEDRGDTLVVTHDAVVRAAVVTAMNRPLDDLWRVRVHNASFAIFDVHDDEWKLVDECANEHLHGLLGELTNQAL